MDAPRPPLRTMRKEMFEVDPNKKYVGKRIAVVDHPEFKGYRGFVVETHPDGDAWVRLDANMQNLVRMSLGDLVQL